MDLIYLFRVLLKRKWIIIGAALVAAVATYFLTGKEPKYYRSTAQISTGFTISDEIRISDQNFNFYEAETKFNNVIVTATSDAVVSLLSYKLILHDLTDPTPFRYLGPEQLQSPLYKQVSKKEAINIFQDKLETMSPLTTYKEDEKKLQAFLKLYGYDNRTLQKKLSVARVQRTDYMQIDYVSENPELSAFIVNNLFQQFLRYYKSIRQGKSQESIDTLQNIMEKKKQILDQKTALLRGESPVNYQDESTNNLGLIADLEKSLADEKGRNTTSSYELRKINQKLSEAGSTKTSNSDNNDDLVSLRRQMNDTYSAYLSSGQTDKSLENKYNSLKTEYQNKVVKLGTTSDRGSNTDINALLEKKSDLEVDIQASNSRISLLQSKIGALKGNLQADASKGASLEVLSKDVELANKEYLEAKQKYNDALDFGSSAANNFRQVIFGQPAIDPEPSKRMILVGMAGAAALVISVLIIIILAYLDSSIKTPIIFQKSVGLKLISIVNFVNFKKRSLTEWVGAAHIEGTSEEKKRHNIFRESIRKLRYEIEKTGKQIFLFTSTKKGQGKTTLIQALAYSMSLSKKKILIIDTNFCNNDLTVQLNAEPVLEKIVPYKAEDGSLLEQVRLFSKDVGAGSVFAIGSEGGDYTPSEILPRENILHHLKQLTEEYDYIFLEGPPLNDFSDSRELAQYVDGVIGIFSATHIVKQIDKESIAFFKELNGKYCGSVLNMVDLKDVNVS